MARISIQHEDFSHYQNEIADYKDFLKNHTGNIDRFRKISKEVFKDKEGEIVLEYITKYQQFDLVQYSDEFSQEKITEGFEAIANEYPECFIDGINTKPAVKMNDNLKIEGSLDDVLRASVKKDNK